MLKSSQTEDSQTAETETDSEKTRGGLGAKRHRGSTSIAGGIWEMEKDASLGALGDARTDSSAREQAEEKKKKTRHYRSDFQNTSTDKTKHQQTQTCPTV